MWGIWLQKKYHFASQKATHPVSSRGNLSPQFAPIYPCIAHSSCTFLANLSCQSILHLGRVKRICYLSPMRAATVQASLRIRAVSPEPPLLVHTSSESRGTFRQKARSLAPLNIWACAVKICHDGMLEDTNSLDGAHLFGFYFTLVHHS